MGLSYSEFKEYVRQREFTNYSSFNAVIFNLNEFYNEEDFKFFYPKNVFNDQEIELIIFLSNGFLSIRPVNDQKWIYEHNYGKVLSKSLSASRYTNDRNELKLLFENGKEVVLESREDSNPDWEDSYSEAIRELYKLI